MMRRMYIHEQPDWPNLHWCADDLAVQLADVRHRQGLLLGKVRELGFTSRQEVTLTSLTEEVVKTSEIEGEILDVELVRSSVARRLGIDFGGLDHHDRKVEGAVDMMLDATERYDKPLTEERLCQWQAALFPTGRSEMRNISVGKWRDGPMQVVSGPIGQEQVHFEAPAAARIVEEMGEFLDWFNSSPNTDPVIKAGLAHLWFVTIHPFDDGNGRVARAIAEMSLARADGTGQRFYSVSSQIRRKRRDYYSTLKGTQRSSTNVTRWLAWFLHCVGEAIDSAETTFAAVTAKERFWKSIAEIAVNDRQQKMINRLLDGFKGNLTTAKWAQITKCSHDTALRDINDLISYGVLLRSKAGGRSTSYDLASTLTNPRSRDA